MKLKNLNEAFELDDKISIVDSLKFAGYTKKIKMNKDGSFDLLADFNGGINQVPPLGINKAKNMTFRGTKFLSTRHTQDMLPKSCKNLSFLLCDFFDLNEFVIKTKISEVLTFDNNIMKSCKKIEIHDAENIEFEGKHNGCNIEIFDVSKINKIKKLSIKNLYKTYNNLGFIKLNSDIDSFNCHVSFKVFDNSKLHVNDYLILYIDKNLKNYYNVTNISCDGNLTLTMLDAEHSNYKSFISILFVKTKNMFLRLYNTNGLNILAKPEHPIKILQKYIVLDLQERTEHVMDCAVELIDAGFEEAAEL